MSFGPNINHHQPGNRGSINQQFGGIINLPLFPNIISRCINMFTDRMLLCFTITASVSTISALSNICLLIHILRNKTSTRTSKNACFGYYLFHASLMAVFASAFAIPFFLASNHVGSSLFSGFDWLRSNGRFFKHASCACIHSTLAAMVYQRLHCLLNSSYKRKSFRNLKLNIVLVWIWSVTSVLPEIVVQSKVDNGAGADGREIRENSSCTIVFIVLSFFVPMAIIVYSRFSVLRLRSTDSVLLVKRCREYRKFGSVCLFLSMVLVFCNLPESVFDLMRHVKFENGSVGDNGKSIVGGFTAIDSDSNLEGANMNANSIEDIELIVSIVSWLYLPALPIVYIVAYRIITNFLTTKNHTTVFFRERSIISNNNTINNDNPINNSSFQRLRHHLRVRLSNNNSAITTNNDDTNSSCKRLQRHDGIFPATGMGRGGVEEGSIEDSKASRSSPEIQNKRQRKLSLNLFQHHYNDNHPIPLTGTSGNNNGRRQSLFERRKSTSSLDDVLEECSRRFSEPNVDLNSELIASCLTTLEALYDGVAENKRPRASSLFRQALQRFSVQAQHRKQRGGDCSTSEPYQESVSYPSMTSPFPHIVHKLNQKKDSVKT